MGNCVLRSPRQRSQRGHLYAETLDGEVIVSDSRVPECDAARALLAKGFTGKLTMLDGETGRPRTIIDIEKAAKLTVLENRRSAPRFVKWSPRPEIDAEGLQRRLKSGPPAPRRQHDLREHLALTSARFDYSSQARPNY